jgi:hypothetical protein
MESLMIFLHIIAWVLGIMSTLYAILLTYWALTYPNSIEELCDKYKGYIKTFKPLKFWAVALVSWAFIIAF